MRRTTSSRRHAAKLTADAVGLPRPVSAGDDAAMRTCGPVRRFARSSVSAMREWLSIREVRGAVAVLAAVSALTACGGGATNADSSTATGASSGSSATPPASTPAASLTTTSSPNATSTATTASGNTASGGGSAGADVAGAPGVPEAARHHNYDGAVAFARHYVDMINETGMHPKVGVLEPLALSGCKTCSGLAQNVADLTKSGSTYSGPQLGHIKPVRMVAGPPTVVGMTAEQLPLTISGPSPTSLPGDPHLGFVFTLEWTTGGWRVARIQADPSLA